MRSLMAELNAALFAAVSMAAGKHNSAQRQARNGNGWCVSLPFGPLFNMLSSRRKS